MNICILHRYPLSDIESTNPSFVAFLEKILAAAHTVTIVTFKDTKKLHFEKKVNIQQINIPFKRSGFVELYVKSLLFIVLAPLKVYMLNKKKKFDLIYCDDSFPFYEIIIKLLTKNTVLIRRGDLMCYYIVERFGLLAKILAKIVFQMEKFTWKKVDGVSVITEQFKQFLLNAGTDEKKIYVIEDSLNFKKFEAPSYTTAIRKKYNINNEFIVMYHGTLLNIKGLEVLIHAIPIVVRKYNHIKFFIIGAGEEFKKLQMLAKKLGIEKYVIFTGWVEYDTIHTYLHMCDIGIPIRKNNLANNLIITTALLQYWASSKPVLAPRLAAIGDVVQENINGFLFEPDNPEALALKIIEAVDKKDYLEQMGKNGRDFAIKKYNSTIISQKMCDFVNFFKK